MTRLSKSPKILIFSPFFYPEPISTGKYNTALATALRDEIGGSGEVTVICSHPLFPRWIVEPTEEQLAGVLAIRGGSGIRYPKSQLARRAVLELWFAFHVAKNIIKLRFAGEEIKGAISIFPPSLFMMLAPILLGKKVPFFGIVHDLQGVYAGTESGSKSGVMRKFIQKAIALVEGRSFSACKQLVFLSETMKKWAVENYKIKNTKSSVHYPFVNLPYGALQKVDVDAVGQLLPAGKKNIVYSGALGDKQAPEKLYAMLQDIVQGNEGWVAHIFSQGPHFERLQSESLNERVMFHPLVPERLLPALLDASDVQVIPQEINTSDGSLPSKLPNIIVSGTHLLCVTDKGSELGNLVREYTGGAVVESWEKSEYLAAFKRLISLPAVRFEDAKAISERFSVKKLVESIDAEFLKRG